MAAFNQQSFRGRNDDGSETTATWKAAVDTDFNQAEDVNFRIRFLFQEADGGNSSENNRFRLQYNLNSAGWNNVTATSSVVRASLSSNFANGDDTTQQIGSGTFITDNNGMEENEGRPANGVDYSGNDEAEFEYCIQIRSADTSPADTIELRMLGGGETVSYTSTPTVTVATPTALLADDITTPAPTLSSPVLNVGAALAADDLTTPAPTLSQPVLTVVTVPQGRLLTLPAETRIMTLDTEQRIVTLPAEQRIVT